MAVLPRPPVSFSAAFPGSTRAADCCAHGSTLPDTWLNAAEPMLSAREVVWVTIAVLAATVAVLVTGA